MVGRTGLVLGQAEPACAYTPAERGWSRSTTDETLGPHFKTIAKLFRKDPDLSSFLANCSMPGGHVESFLQR